MILLQYIFKSVLIIKKVMARLINILGDEIIAGIYLQTNPNNGLSYVQTGLDPRPEELMRIYLSVKNEPQILFDAESKKYIERCTIQKIANGQNILFRENNNDTDNIILVTKRRIGIDKEYKNAITYFINRFNEKHECNKQCMNVLHIKSFAKYFFVDGNKYYINDLL